MRFHLVLFSCLGVSLGALNVGAVDTLDPVDLLQEASTSVRSDTQADSDQWRLKVLGHDGADSLISEATVPCYDATSDITTLLQPDLARISLELDADVCGSPDPNGHTTANAVSELTFYVDRTSRKVVSLANVSTSALSGTAELNAADGSNQLWEVDLGQYDGTFESAFAIELPAGEYTLGVNATQESPRSGTTNLRLSVVNRGDVNGNERFDAADLAVIDAILQQDVFVDAADLNDDGLNNSEDRRLWVDGLQPDQIQTSQGVQQRLVSRGQSVSDSPPFAMELGSSGIGDLDKADIDESFQQLGVVDSGSPSPTDGAAGTDTPSNPDPLPDVPELDFTPTIPDIDQQRVTPEAAIVLLGDFDGDGALGFGDFLEFARAFDEPAEVQPEADFNADGRIGFPDFLVFVEKYRGLEPTTAVVPEPSALNVFGLLAVASWVCFCQTANRSSRRRTRT